MHHSKHLWEIDTLRGIAIVGMVVYHLLYDLRFFWGMNIPVFSYPLLLLAQLTGSLFVFLVGISASLKFHSLSTKSTPLLPIIFSFTQRSVIIIFWALIITLVTYLLFPTEFVVFGILHLIGLSLLLLIPFLFVKSKTLLFLSGLIIIITGIIIANGSISSSALFWLGLKPKNFVSLDYYPLFPWFGLVILGLLFGRLYPHWRSRFNLFDRQPHIAIFSFLGKHSLLIYLLHQPALISILYLLKFIVN